MWAAMSGSSGRFSRRRFGAAAARRRRRPPRPDVGRPFVDPHVERATLDLLAFGAGSRSGRGAPLRPPRRRGVAPRSVAWPDGVPAAAAVDGRAVGATTRRPPVARPVVGSATTPARRLATLRRRPPGERHGDGPDRGVLGRRDLRRGTADERTAFGHRSRCYGLNRHPMDDPPGHARSAYPGAVPDRLVSMGRRSRSVIQYRARASRRGLAAPSTARAQVRRRVELMREAGRLVATALAESGDTRPSDRTSSTWTAWPRRSSATMAASRCSRTTTRGGHRLRSPARSARRSTTSSSTASRAVNLSWTVTS